VRRTGPGPTQRRPVCTAAARWAQEPVDSAQRQGGASAGVVPARRGEAVRPGIAAALFDLSRGRQALLNIVQPGIGAVLAAGGLPGARTLGIGLVASWAGFFAVFSLNDVLDRKVDTEALRSGQDDREGFDVDTAFQLHPLAHGTLSLRLSVAWVLGLGAVAAVGAALLSPLALLFFALAVAIEMVYCALRRVTWAKTFLSGLMVGCGGLAGWAAVAPLRPAALTVFAFLLFWELSRNLANDLSDLRADAAVGIRTVATTFGPVASTRANLLATSAMLASVVFLTPHLAGLAVALAGAVWLVVLPVERLLRRPQSAVAAAYFNRMSWYPEVVLLAVLASAAAGRL
jgi:4-hydroxybenzoate polyprenyltransferase